MHPRRTRHRRSFAKETVGYKLSDFVFDGSMEHKYDESLPVFTEFAKALTAEKHLEAKPYPHIAYPMIVKVPRDRTGSGARRQTHRSSSWIWASPASCSSASKAPMK